jgi:hypothetical protein
MHHKTMRQGGRFILAAMAGISFFTHPSHSSITGFSIPAGLLYEYNFYHQFGIRASIAHDLILKGHPRLAVSYTTSRLSALAGRNILIKDDVRFNASWYFRPEKWIDPYAGIDVGFTRFNRENDEIFSLLDNRAGLFNLRVGIASTLLGGRLRPSIDGGLSIASLISTSPAPVFPLFFSIGVDFDVAKGVLP